MMETSEFLSLLESGELRAAVCESDGQWSVNTKVKEGILNAFREGRNQTCLPPWEAFIDKNTIPAREFRPEDGVRIVPGGSSVRRGAFVASGVIIMPPAYVNIGAYIDEGSMVDSNALVGSCAQIGKRVHLSAGVQIGGVLEPIGMRPVIIEDEVFVGAQSCVVEGICVRKRAVIAPGVNLSKGVPVYDCVKERELEQGEDIPEGAVVVPGTRPPSREKKWALDQGLSLQCALIIKYRDDKSNASLTLEEALR